VLVGRTAELEQIERLLGDARAGQGGALVLRGEAGIGKTALLEQAASRAEGISILRALGVEAEAELPYSALHEVLRPILHLVDELPEPQTVALKAAFALAPTERVDRFSIYMATLSLLAAAAYEEAVLCLVDDAQWLDQASAEALAFAARRIHDEAMLMLFGARDPAETSFASPGIPELRLGGLTPAEAKALLETAAPTLPERAGEHVIDISRGNPLALLEFGATGAEAWAAGDVGPLPVGESVERSFLERSSRLSADARQALLFAAAGDPNEPDAIWAALEGEQVSADAISEGQAEGLLVRGHRLDFCHGGAGRGPARPWASAGLLPPACALCHLACGSTRRSQGCPRRSRRDRDVSRAPGVAPRRCGSRAG
jgi:hypothetical protein